MISDLLKNKRTSDAGSYKEKYEKLIALNEPEATQVLGRLQLYVAFVYFLGSILNALGIMSSASVAVYVSFFICGIIMTVLSLFELTLMHGRPSPALKYISNFMLIFSVLVVNIVTGYKLWLLYAVPVILSVRFYNKKFTAVSTVFSMLMTFISAYTNAYISKYTRVLDLNMVSFNDPGTLSYSSWLHNAVLNHGFDPSLIVKNALRLSVFPNCIILLIILFSLNSIIDNAVRILVLENEAHDKEMMMHKDATTDSMTGLLNRRAYDEYTETLSGGIPKNLVYVLFDVDGLKQTNDTLGHNAGDELIISAARCIKQTFEPYGKVYRWGGDEFAALILADKRQLKSIIGEFEQRVSGTLCKTAGRLSVSFGNASASEMEAPFTLDDMEALADKRMYEVKKLHHENSGQT